MTVFDDIMREMDAVARQFPHNWRCGASRIIAAADFCARLEHQTKVKAVKQNLLLRLGITEHLFRTLADIGRNEYLRSPNIVRLLPNSLTTIHALSQLLRPDLDALIQDGILEPSLTKARLERWLAARSSTDHLSRRLPKHLYVGLRFIRRPTQQQVDELDKMVQLFSELPNVAVIKHTLRSETGRWQERVDAFVRERVRKRVRAMKAAYRSAHGGFDPRGRRDAYGFVEEEIEVTKYSDRDELKAVLLSLGGDALDYESFLAEAHERYPMPGPDVPDDDQMPLESNSIAESHTTLIPGSRARKSKPLQV